MACRQQRRAEERARARVAESAERARARVAESAERFRGRAAEGASRASAGARPQAAGSAALAAPGPVAPAWGGAFGAKEAPPWAAGPEAKEAPGGVIQATTSQGLFEIPLGGAEHLSPAQQAGLGAIRPVEIHLHTALADALALVPPDALVAAFVCVVPLPAAEWAGRAWQLRAASLQRKPGRATFFCPDCPFLRLPSAEEAPRI
ncbi:MAG TPA: hypothetical protein VNI01_00290 [Elusimicrobiota bacterium]|jgi:hypothetical protein|nr:hypothetical protein [Elusimicrobiota bacterium]